MQHESRARVSEFKTLGKHGYVSQNGEGFGLRQPNRSGIWGFGLQIQGDQIRRVSENGSVTKGSSRA